MKYISIFTQLYIFCNYIFPLGCCCWLSFHRRHFYPLHKIIILLKWLCHIVKTFDNQRYCPPEHWNKAQNSFFAFLAPLWYQANVTQSKCQKYANCDVIWVPSITRKDQFLSLLKGQGIKTRILTYVAVFRGGGEIVNILKNSHYVTESL